MKNSECLELIRDALEELAYSPSTKTAKAKHSKAVKALKQLRAQIDDVPWYKKIQGKTVSMDVSTGEEDSSNRVFGVVYEVVLQSCGAEEHTILAIESERNF